MVRHESRIAILDEAALTSWTLEPVPTVALIVTAAIYLRGFRKLNRQVPRQFPWWRATCFLGGLAAIFVSVNSPLDAFASFLLLSHMAQHLLLTMVAPPLIWLGVPQLPLLRGLPRRLVVDGIAPFLTYAPLLRIIHVVTHPMVAWSAFVLSNVLWHLPDFYDAALRSEFWHEIEHASFLGTSLLFWWHVVQPWPSRPVWPRWAIIPYLLLADLQNTALAAFLSFQDRILYETYRTAPRISELSALEDQSGAGALMWVPGSMAFLIPAGFIAMKLLSPRSLVRRDRPTPAPRFKPKPRKPAQSFDVLTLPVIGSFLRSRMGRRSLQFVMFTLAALVVWDGLTGPPVTAMNAAGVLPWTHWRTFTVMALLVAGNLFCMVCPFTFFRDLGRKFLPARLIWPGAFRSKWLAVILLVLYLWAYEAFDLWDRPAVTAGVILGYFFLAVVVDGFFRGASFCQYICPIGQFHFAQSLVSPLEIRIKSPSACADCRTKDCLRGNEKQRGCELHLLQPAKQGNMDCTFCLDCVKACPVDNVGMLPVTPGYDILHDRARSTVGNFARRPDLAVLILVLTFGAYANAAGMVVPVMDQIDAWVKQAGAASDLLPVTLLSFLFLVLIPLALTGLAAFLSGGGRRWREHFCRFSIALLPAGFGMWLAHFVFHFFTAALTPIPVLQRFAHDLGLSPTEPFWNIPSLAFYELPALEILFLNAGILGSLYLLFKIAEQLSPRRLYRTFLPWAALTTLLYLAGLWIIFQPMEMRGTLMH